MAVDNILIDTNAYVLFKQGDSEVIEIIRYAPFIGLNAIVLGELLAGFAVGNRELHNRQELEGFLKSPRVNFFAIEHETTEYYAAIYKELRAKGRPVPTNDLWIAATALQYNLTVFTYDKYFKSIERVRTGKCLADFIRS
ncbi:PilT protein-like [Desulfamplus magnetovallimortis]|uniref:PilT protein-like n=1 Tax=Desulfamplus magnetovallimortis TaxID=1246637 RepID=A0A1W1H8U6_9BACT|nr:type II toxin-antitoxin system VapC family toxin [Desulfamplus magnetovallimortis]SLM28907.1 PilT protein-like [Desulfamplus magnetovallimortis]